MKIPRKGTTQIRNKCKTVRSKSPERIKRCRKNLECKNAHRKSHNHAIEDGKRTKRSLHHRNVVPLPKKRLLFETNSPPQAVIRNIPIKIKRHTTECRQENNDKCQRNSPAVECRCIPHKIHYTHVGSGYAFSSVSPESSQSNSPKCVIPLKHRDNSKFRRRRRETTKSKKDRSFNSNNYPLQFGGKWQGRSKKFNCLKYPGEINPYLDGSVSPYYNETFESYIFDKHFITNKSPISDLCAYKDIQRGFCGKQNRFHKCYVNKESPLSSKDMISLNQYIKNGHKGAVRAKKYSRKSEDRERAIGQKRRSRLSKTVVNQATRNNKFQKFLSTKKLEYYDKMGNLRKEAITLIPTISKNPEKMSNRYTFHEPIGSMSTFELSPYKNFVDDDMFCTCEDKQQDKQHPTISKNPKKMSNRYTFHEPIRGKSTFELSPHKNFVDDDMFCTCEDKQQGFGGKSVGINYSRDTNKSIFSSDDSTSLYDYINMGHMITTHNFHVADDLICKCEDRERSTIHKRRSRLSRTAANQILRGEKNYYSYKSNERNEPISLTLPPPNQQTKTSKRCFSSEPLGGNFLSLLSPKRSRRAKDVSLDGQYPYLLFPRTESSKSCVSELMSLETAYIPHFPKKEKVGFLKSQDEKLERSAPLAATKSNFLRYNNNNLQFLSSHFLPICKDTLTSLTALLQTKGQPCISRYRLRKKQRSIRRSCSVMDTTQTAPGKEMLDMLNLTAESKKCLKSYNSMMHGAGDERSRKPYAALDQFYESQLKLSTFTPVRSLKSKAGMVEKRELILNDLGKGDQTSNVDRVAHQVDGRDGGDFKNDKFKEMISLPSKLSSGIEKKQSYEHDNKNMTGKCHLKKIDEGHDTTAYIQENHPKDLHVTKSPKAYGTQQKSINAVPMIFATKDVKAMDDQFQTNRQIISPRKRGNDGEYKRRTSINRNTPRNVEYLQGLHKTIKGRYDKDQSNINTVHVKNHAVNLENFEIKSTVENSQLTAKSDSPHVNIENSKLQNTSSKSKLPPSSMLRSVDLPHSGIPHNILPLTKYLLSGGCQNFGDIKINTIWSNSHLSVDSDSRHSTDERKSGISSPTSPSLKCINKCGLSLSEFINIEPVNQWARGEESYSQDDDLKISAIWSNSHLSLVPASILKTTNKNLSLNANLFPENPNTNYAPSKAPRTYPICHIQQESSNWSNSYLSVLTASHSQSSKYEGICSLKTNPESVSQRDLIRSNDSLQKYLSILPVSHVRPRWTILDCNNGSWSNSYISVESASRSTKNEENVTFNAITNSNSSRDAKRQKVSSAGCTRFIPCRQLSVKRKKMTVKHKGPTVWHDGWESVIFPQKFRQFKSNEKNSQLPLNRNEMDYVRAKHNNKNNLTKRVRGTKYKNPIHKVHENDKNSQLSHSLDKDLKTCTIYNGKHILKSPLRTKSVRKMSVKEDAINETNHDISAMCPTYTSRHLEQKEKPNLSKPRKITNDIRKRLRQGFKDRYRQIMATIHDSRKSRTETKDDKFGCLHQFDIEDSFPECKEEYRNGDINKSDNSENNMKTSFRCQPNRQIASPGKAQKRRKVKFRLPPIEEPQLKRRHKCKRLHCGVNIENTQRGTTDTHNMDSCSQTTISDPFEDNPFEKKVPRKNRIVEAYQGRVKVLQSIFDKLKIKDVWRGKKVKRNVESSFSEKNRVQKRLIAKKVQRKQIKSSSNNETRKDLAERKKAFEKILGVQETSNKGKDEGPNFAWSFVKIEDESSFEKMKSCNLNHVHNSRINKKRNNIILSSSSAFPQANHVENQLSQALYSTSYLKHFYKNVSDHMFMTNERGLTSVEIYFHWDKENQNPWDKKVMLDAFTLDALANAKSTMGNTCYQESNFEPRQYGSNKNGITLAGNPYLTPEESTHVLSNNKHGESRFPKQNLNISVSVQNRANLNDSLRLYDAQIAVLFSSHLLNSDLIAIRNSPFTSYFPKNTASNRLRPMAKPNILSIYYGCENSHYDLSQIDDLDTRETDLAERYTCNKKMKKSTNRCRVPDTTHCGLIATASKYVQHSDKDYIMTPSDNVTSSLSIWRQILEETKHRGHLNSAISTLRRGANCRRRQYHICVVAKIQVNLLNSIESVRILKNEPTHFIMTSIISNTENCVDTPMAHALLSGSLIENAENKSSSSDDVSTDLESNCKSNSNKNQSLQNDLESLLQFQISYTKALKGQVNLNDFFSFLKANHDRQVHTRNSSFKYTKSMVEKEGMKESIVGGTSRANRHKRKAQRCIGNDSTRERRCVTQNDSNMSHGQNSTNCDVIPNSKSSTASHQPNLTNYHTVTNPKSPSVISQSISTNCHAVTSPKSSPVISQSISTNCHDVTNTKSSSVISQSISTNSHAVTSPKSLTVTYQSHKPISTNVHAVTSPRSLTATHQSLDERAPLSFRKQSKQCDVRKRKKVMKPKPFVKNRIKHFEPVSEDVISQSISNCHEQRHCQYETTSEDKDDINEESEGTYHSSATYDLISLNSDTRYSDNITELIDNGKHLDYKINDMHCNPEDEFDSQSNFSTSSDITLSWANSSQSEEDTSVSKTSIRPNMRTHAWALDSRCLANSDPIRSKPLDTLSGSKFLCSQPYVHVIPLISEEKLKQTTSDCNYKVNASTSGLYGSHFTDDIYDFLLYRGD